MNFTARVFAIIAFVSLLAWPLRADDTPKPEPTAKAVTTAHKNGGAAGAAKAPAAKPAPAPRSTRRGSDAPRVELFLGYSNILGTPKVATNRFVDLQGGDTNIAFNLNRYFGIVGDFAGYHANTLTFNGIGGTVRDVPAEGTSFTYMGGPRLSFRQSHFTLFGQALFGDASAGKVTVNGCTGSSVCTALPSQNTFAMALGGGLDLKLQRHIALRLIQAEYLMTRFKDPTSPTGTDGTRNNVRLSAGIVFSFGAMGAPPEPARADCSAQPSEVFAGDFVTATARGSNFDSERTIRYNWNGTGVNVTGSDFSTQIDTTGLRAGSYGVTANLSDGSKNGSASCSASFTVKEARPPVISCSADPATLLAGATSTISSNASSPDDRKLTYSYAASAGEISGDTASATLNAGAAQPGVITITCNVSDDRNPSLTASSTTIVNVQAPPAPVPSPEMKQLEANLALHSIYFQTARPTEKNPEGGLLDSQAQILKTLADDFTAYLKYSPDAHLILAGHADPRGSVEYNQGLTQRRVDRAKNFLVDHGVPADHIDTQSLGKHDQLTADQIKALMAQDPNLTPADRQQMLNNLPVMVLANNRRVDVTLSTTGQESTRLYPFNAKDFLALISTKAGK